MRHLLRTLLVLFCLATSSHGLATTVELDAQGIRLDGQYRLLRGGSVQWFRLPLGEWRDRLERFKAAGFNTVDLYVPWSLIEPEPGQFNFDTPSLGAFLALCRELGLYVYLRPGPYITNEIDGGGIPYWLTAHSSKRAIAADGVANLRTADPDYLLAVRRYFKALNAYVRPYLASQGGPIILYAIENEYNWFEPFFNLEKVFRYQGQFERSWDQHFSPALYLTALRDMAREDGIDVPITTCPGDGLVSATGDIADVLPWANIYRDLLGQPPEVSVRRLLDDMHTPGNHQDRYRDMPAGTSETDRMPHQLKRMLHTGLDATFAFNIVGMHQEGYMNALIVDPTRLQQPFDWQWGSLGNAFIHLGVGHFGSVTDFSGAVSASGLLRQSFYELRRDNLLIDWLEPLLAPQGQAHRALPGDAYLRLDNPALGVTEAEGQVHYWQPLGEQARLISLVNDSASAQRIEPGGLHIGKRNLPRYQALELPARESSASQFSAQEQGFTQWLPIDLPVRGSLTLTYSTSEPLTLRTLNGEHWLILHGPKGAERELSLDGRAGWQVVAQDAGIQVRSDTGTQLDLSYRHQGPLQLQLRGPTGELLHILLLDSDQAGRSWFVSHGGKDWLVVGADYLLQRGASWRIEQDDAQKLSVYGPPLPLPASWRATSAEAWQQRTDWQTPTTTLPAYHVPIIQAASWADTAEAQPAYDDSQWQHWQGEPRALEQLGMAPGHAWYRGRFALDALPARWQAVELQLDSVADHAGIYLNGHYLGTVSSLGNALDSRALADPAPFLQVGENVLAVRISRWGRGSFMFPRGHLLGTSVRLGAVGYDSLKGLSGPATLNGRLMDAIAISDWRVRAGLGAEALLRSDSATAPTNLPLTLAPGEVRWLAIDLPDSLVPEAGLHAPRALRLNGRNLQGTLFLNGVVIGRWLSDNHWLGQGQWADVERGQWARLSPDDFPLATSRLQARGNRLLIALQDSSAPGAQARLDSLELIDAAEVLRYEGHALARKGQPSRVWQGKLPAN